MPPVSKLNYSNETLSVLVEKCDERIQCVEERLERVECKIDDKFDQFNNRFDQFSIKFDSVISKLTDKTIENEKDIIINNVKHIDSNRRIDEIDNEIKSISLFHDGEKINKASWKKIVTVISLLGTFVVGLVTVLSSFHIF